MERHQMTKWRMQITCWNTRATNSIRLFNLLLFYSKSNCINVSQRHVICIYIASSAKFIFRHLVHTTEKRVRLH
jgi:hypothetical protein